MSLRIRVLAPTLGALVLVGGTFGLTRIVCSQPEGILVASVIDGDTIALENGETVRYLGVDTPETVHPTKPVQCYGPEASEANRQLVGGKRVRLESDVTDRDQYGRLLRYVYVDGVFVEAELVRGGYAYVYTRQPDVKYLKDLAALEREARDAERGLWGACVP